MDKYTITDTILGKGGFASVYLAHVNRTGDKVAVKKTKKIVKEEISILEVVRSHHCVRYLESFEDKHKTYIIMELVEGVDLHRKIEEEGALSEPTCKGICRQLTSAVEYLHRDLNVAHFDVKPENIMLCNNNIVKIIDFGCSKRYDPTAEKSIFRPCGTLLYAAPEIIGRVLVSGASPISLPTKNLEALDVYGLGVVLYYCHHASLPFYPSSWPSLKHQYEQALALELCFLSEPSGLLATPSLYLHMIAMLPESRATLREIRQHVYLDEQAAAGYGCGVEAISETSLVKRRRLCQ